MNEKKRLVIIGAGGHGRVCADIALKMNKWKEIAFLDDDPTLDHSMGIPIIGPSREFGKCVADYDIFVAIGNNKVRSDIYAQLESCEANIPVLVHPKAVLGEGVSIGAGTVVMAGSVVNPCTKIGKGCIINTGSTIDHDCVIEDYVHISPGVNVAGSVSIGAFTWLGIGSVVNNNLSITSGCTVGAGAVVIADILEPGTYVGVPARRIK